MMAKSNAVRPSRLRRLLIGLLGLGVVLAVVLGVAGALSLWLLLRGSVPRLDGEVRLPALAAPLSMKRDSLGTVTLRGSDRNDLARGLGYVHAQERFFEMDLTRRSAAGELSALFGSVALDRDKQRRVHRMRARYQQALALLEPNQRALLQAYTDGVNAGLADLPVRPWQYLLLRAEPAAWQPTDSLLVIGEMFWMLQANSVERGLDRALLRERIGDAMFTWLEPAGGRWDSALDASVSAVPAMPGPDALDLRRMPAGSPAKAALSTPEPAAIGSSQWAVSGQLTSTGAAMLANDMHLGLSAPSIWFRTQLELAAPGAAAVRAAGVSLPGAPTLVVGSNGHVAWGFTNAYGQWFDWVRVPADLPADRLHHAEETIAIKNAAPARLDVADWDGLPIVLERDGQRYALRWIAHDPGAANVVLDGMLFAQDIGQALAIAQRSGVPHQNIALADSAGHVAWTIAGRMWAGRTIEGRFARLQSSPGRAPEWLAPADYPVVRDPPNGRIWTANNRQLAGAGGDVIGSGGFDLGARAKQIHARLAERTRFDEPALGAIHFDDDAPFMRDWGRRIRSACLAAGEQAAIADALDTGAAAQAGRWNGRADADQPGYLLVRTTRQRTLDLLWDAWTTPLLGDMQADRERRFKPGSMFENTVEQALDARPAHLLPQPYATWDSMLCAQATKAMDDMTQGGKRPWTQATWGDANVSHIQHVLSRAVPVLARWLDMPARPQSGDSNLPHVAQPGFGQSERLVVSPGHESTGILAMPGGQSGHPLSPYYGAGHDDWVAGRPTPLLAGPAAHELVATPGGR